MTKHGRYMLTPEYRSFKESLGEELVGVAGVEALDGDLEASIYQYSNHDVDALLKPVLDVMEDVGVIENDKNVMRATMSREPKKKRSDPDRISFSIWKMDNMDNEDNEERGE